MDTCIIQCQYQVLLSHLEYYQYEALSKELNKLDNWQSEAINHLLDLAKAILAVDLTTVNQKAPHTPLSINTSVSSLERKAYYYLQTLTLQLSRGELADYLRGLTPLLVDLFRLSIERDFFPRLSEFIQPISKPTVDNQPLYRGIQWSRERVELDNNIIRKTWAKYYGHTFNYDHYVSSSHLVKLIETQSKNEKLITLTGKIRRLEKYLRNLAAHEVVKVDEEYFTARVQMTPEEVHAVLLELYDVIGLTDTVHRNVLNIINKELKSLLTEQFQLISRGV